MHCNQKRKKLIHSDGLFVQHMDYMETNPPHCYKGLSLQQKLSTKKLFYQISKTMSDLIPGFMDEIVFEIESSHNLWRK